MNFSHLSASSDDWRIFFFNIYCSTNSTRSVQEPVPQPGASGPLSNAKFLNAIFSPDAIEKKRNTEAVEAASNTLISGRIVQYTPARTKPLAEVKDDVRQRLVASRAAEEARKDGAAKLAAWKAAPDTATLLPAMVVSRDQLQKLPAKIVETALKADASTLPVFAGVDLGAQGYAVVKLLKVLPRDPALGPSAKQEQDQNPHEGDRVEPGLGTALGGQVLPHDGPHSPPFILPGHDTPSATAGASVSAWGRAPVAESRSEKSLSIIPCRKQTSRSSMSPAL